VSIGR